jgi:hypothetical protein
MASSMKTIRRKNLEQRRTKKKPQIQDGDHKPLNSLHQKQYNSSQHRLKVAIRTTDGDCHPAAKKTTLGITIVIK